jgi:hypothetical protein
VKNVTKASNTWIKRKSMGLLHNQKDLSHRIFCMRIQSFEPDINGENDDIEIESDSIYDVEIEEEDDELENTVNDTVNKTFINHPQVNNSVKIVSLELLQNLM